MKHTPIPKLFAVLVIITVLAVIGTVEWLLWQKQDNDQSTKLSGTNQPAERQTGLSLADDQLPAGWSQDKRSTYNDVLTVTNPTLGCSAEVVYRLDGAGSNDATVDQPSQTLQTIRGKGYSVQELPATTLQLQRTSQRQSLPAQALGLSGVGQPSFQQYAYETTDRYSLSVQLSCAAQADLANAQQALLAIRIPD